MIHQYKNNGYNIVLDVYSGAVHVVDDLCYDVIAVLNEPDEEPTAEILKSDLTWENLKKRLGDTYSEEDLRDALDDVIELTCSESVYSMFSHVSSLHSSLSFLTFISIASSFLFRNIFI